MSKKSSSKKKSKSKKNVQKTIDATQKKMNVSKNTKVNEVSKCTKVTSDSNSSCCTCKFINFFISLCLNLRKYLKYLFFICLLGLSVAGCYWLYQKEAWNIFLPYIPARYLGILVGFPILLSFIFILWLGKWCYERTIAFCLKHELTENDNPAVGLYFAGFLLSVGIGVSGAVCDWHQGILNTIIFLCFGVVISIFLVRLSGYLFDTFLFPKFSILKEIRDDRNVGIGAICFGAFVGTGFIIRASFIGEGGVWWALGISILGAFLVGQVVFIIGGLLFQKFAAYNFLYEIEERDNPAAGILLGMFLLSLGLIVSNSVMDFNVAEIKHFPVSWEEALKTNERELLSKELSLSSELIVSLREDNKTWTIHDVQKNENYLVLPSQESFSVVQFKNWKEILSELGGAGLFGIISSLILLILGKLAGYILFHGISLVQEVQQKNIAVAFVLSVVYIVVAWIGFSVF